MSCIRQEQMVNQTSIAYLSTGGRLGNAMSTYAAMLALRHQFGIEAMVDLTTFQLLAGHGVQQCERGSHPRGEGVQL